MRELLIEAKYALAQLQGSYKGGQYRTAQELSEAIRKLLEATREQGKR